MITIKQSSAKRAKLAYRSICARFKLRIPIARAAIRAGVDAVEYENFELGLPSVISHREFHTHLLQLEWEATNGHPLP